MDDFNSPEVHHQLTPPDGDSIDISFSSDEIENYDMYEDEVNDSFV